MYNSNVKYSYDSESTKETKEMNYNKTMTETSMGTMPGMMCSPIYECPQERVIHREFVHEVPHVCPVNTRIVNHHIYKHTYSPCYTCCEENEICNVTEGCCQNF